MKYIFTTIIVLLQLNLLAQDQNVSSLINQTRLDKLLTTVRELSGEDSATIDGEKVLITHRVSNWGNDLAAAYIKDKLSQYNLTVEEHNYRSGGKNIIATQLGKTNPENIYIICGHYDSVTDFCADDNASGTAAVMEAARILSQYSFDNTIIYALWDEEEIGLIGAGYYASAANANDDNILGVLNLDMISYDGDNDMEFDIDSNTDPKSLEMKDSLINIVNNYGISLIPNVIVPGTPLSDHKKFWDNGYPAVLVGEAWSIDDQNPEYHTQDDQIEIFNTSYFFRIVKVAVGYMATMAVKNDLFGVTNATVCDTYTSPSGKIWTESGVYNDTIPNSDVSADSIITVYLTVNYSTTSILDEYACDSYKSPSGKLWTEPGTYFDTIPNNSDCDSLMTINLNIGANTFSSVDTSACDRFISPTGKVWKRTGTYTDILDNATNCDSVITFNLTILNTADTVDITTCDVYTGPSGQVWTSSGTYIDVIPNSASCDSTITVNLTINENTSATIDEEACESYTSPSGQLWISSGTYNDMIPNEAGCDSLITVNLSIHENSSSTINETTCESYTGPSGTVYTTSGTYTETIPNSNECDSLITINLTINTATESTIEATACQSFTSPSGQIFDTSGTYNDVIPNEAGCDSLITINLTINNIDATVSQSGFVLTANNSNATYQWINCEDNSAIAGETNQSLNVNEIGNYAVQVTENGCTETSDCVSVTTVGLVENSFDFDIKLFPNPTKNFINLSLEKSFDEVKIDVFNLNGQLIMEKRFEQTNQLKVDLSSLNNAVYIIQISANDQKAIFRLLKE